MAPKYISVPHAATKYGFHKLQLYRLIKRGEIPVGIHLRLGGRVYLHEERFNEWLAGGGTASVECQINDGSKVGLASSV